MTTVTPLDCSTVIAQLWDYLDGELDAVRLGPMEAHLATCTGCASHVEFCRAFLAQVKTTPMAAGEVEAVRARIIATLR